MGLHARAMLKVLQVEDTKLSLEGLDLLDVLQQSILRRFESKTAASGSSGSNDKTASGNKTVTIHRTVLPHLCTCKYQVCTTQVPFKNQVLTKHLVRTLYVPYMDQYGVLVLKYIVVVQGQDSGLVFSWSRRGLGPLQEVDENKDLLRRSNPEQGEVRSLKLVHMVPGVCLLHDIVHVSGPWHHHQTS